MPPKLSAVVPQDEKLKVRQERQQDRRKALLARKMMGDLIGDAAEEVQEKGIDDVRNSVKLPKRFIDK